MTRRTPEITVIIPTRNRDSVLFAALESHAAQRPEFDWELIVVDNGSTDHTQQVLAEFVQKLPLVATYYKKPGKSRCLNCALEIARGKLIAFTDDDVYVSQKWLSELYRASQVYRAAVFCGPIMPVFPDGTPKWLPDHQFAMAAFAKFSPQIGEGILPAQLTPLGPNFMVRAEFISNLRFRPDLGPSDAGNFMSEDTEFLGRVRQLGHDFIYVPGAEVFHVIRESLVKLTALYDRAFNLGRSMIIANRHAVITQKKDDSDPESLRFSRAVLANYYLGQICELQRLGIPYMDVLATLKKLNWLGGNDVISPGAREWVEGNSFMAWIDSPGN